MVNPQTHEAPREGAGAGTAGRHQASLQRLCLSKCPRSPLEQELELCPKVTSSESPPGLPCPCPCKRRAHAQCAVRGQIPHPKEKSHLADAPNLPGPRRPLHSAGPWARSRLRLHFPNRAVWSARPCFRTWATTSHRPLPRARGCGERGRPQPPPDASRAHLQKGVETHV